MPSLESLLSKVGNSKIAKLLKVLPKLSRKMEQEQANEYAGAKAKVKNMKEICLEKGKLLKEFEKNFKASMKGLDISLKAFDLLPEVDGVKKWVRIQMNVKKQWLNLIL